MTGCSCCVRFQPFELGAGSSTVVFHAVHIFTSGAIPYPEEYFLQFVDSIALNAAVHVAPFTNLLSTLDVVIGYVHATRIGYLSVDDDYLTVVAPENLIQPGETDWFVFHNLDAVVAQSFQVVFLQWLVVGIVAEAVEHRTYFNPFFTLFAKQVEE